MSTGDYDGRDKVGIPGQLYLENLDREKQALYDRSEGYPGGRACLGSEKGDKTVRVGPPALGTHELEEV